MTHLSTEQEDVDTTILLHALDASSRGGLVNIMSPDTDVFILVLYHLRQLGMDTCLITAVSDKRRTIRLKNIYEALGDHLPKNYTNSTMDPFCWSRN